MKYKLLLSLFVVSVLACGVAEAAEYSGDLDALEETLTGKTPKEVVEIIGEPPTRVSGSHREFWTYGGTFFDTVTQNTFKKLQIYFKNKKAKIFFLG